MARRKRVAKVAAKVVARKAYRTALRTPKRTLAKKYATVSGKLKYLGKTKLRRKRRSKRY